MSEEENLLDIVEKQLNEQKKYFHEEMEMKRPQIKEKNVCSNDI